jgi:hypothetical protein
MSRYRLCVTATRDWISFTDAGISRSDVRPSFEALLARLVELPADAKPAVVVTDLSRLFRNREDRARIADLLDAQRIDVIAIDEKIDTADVAGRARFDRGADLVMAAWEGLRPAQMPASSRGELIEAYMSQILRPWFELRGVPEAEIVGPLADVETRLRSLALRWDDGRATPLLAPFAEVAQVHDPAETPLAIRELALIAVRNSALEDLHLAGHIKQWHWRELTSAAAHALVSFPELAVGQMSTLGNDPFDGVLERNPTAATALRVLADLQPGEEATWTMPEVDLPAIPSGDEAVRMDDGREVLHALDPRISVRMAAMLRRACEEQGILTCPSLKHFSRHPGKLFRIVDCVLAHGGTVVTANVMITREKVVRRKEVVSYNDLDFGWSGIPNVTFAASKVGRNDPCPCGSGLKHKRCCGR